MGVIGFSFTKFDCVRNTNKIEGSIEIKHNINIKNVEKTSFNVSGNKNDVLKVVFNFDIIYGNNFGKISLEGDLIYSDTKEIIDESAKSWKSDKKLNPIVHEQIFKFIYNKTIIKALELADSLGLPSPIPLPKISFENKK